MKRKFLEELKDWKDRNIKEPLMIVGARQTGKTYIIDEFCRDNYEKYLYLNFEDISKLSSVFEHTLVPKEIINQIEILIEEKIDVDKTVIFFDEIQICEKAITSLKYFCEAEENYRIITAGSLLGVKLHRFESSFPVGKVRILNMYPMDFEEFLWAIGEENLSKEIRICFTNKRPMSDILHEKAIRYYTDYLYVGGMPQAILNYIEHERNSMLFERIIHNSIITAYIADMRKYTISGAETIKINEIYDSIPKQLAKENTKFKYNLVKPTANKRDYALPLDWLVASSLVYKANKLERPETPLRVFIDNTNFKIYLNDVGLLSTLANVSYQDIQLNQNNIFKGALTENYVAQELKSKQIDLIYYKPTQTMEIDFVIAKENQVIPIEVKAGEHIKSRSMSNYILKHNPPYAIRISARNFGFTNHIYSIPLYAVFCLG